MHGLLFRDFKIPRKTKLHASLQVGYFYLDLQNGQNNGPFTAYTSLYFGILAIVLGSFGGPATPHALVWRLEVSPNQGPYHNPISKALRTHVSGLLGPKTISYCGAFGLF